MRAKGVAEAEAIQAKGLAEAEAMEKVNRNITVNGLEGVNLTVNQKPDNTEL